MENKAERQRIEYLPFVSVIAAFSVLVLHSNGVFWAFSTDSYWKSANVIESVFYFAVPLFFMMTGITLMDYQDRYSLSEYFKKRMFKVLIPYIFWSVISILWFLYFSVIELRDITPVFLYRVFFESKLVPIYWFFPSIFVIYLSFPLFASVEKEKRKSIFTYLAVVGIILNSLIPFFEKIFELETHNTIQITVVSGALIWPIIGWLLANTEFKNYQKIIIYVFALAGLLLHILGTYNLSMKANTVVTTFKGYENIPCILYSIGIFVLLKDVGSLIMKRDSWFKKFILCLSKYTFPVYLMQFILLDIANNLDFINIYSLLYRLGGPIYMFIIIVGVTWVLRKIPIIKYIVP